MTVLKFAVLLCSSMLTTALYAAKIGEQPMLEHDFYLLQHYKLIYTEEIFDYCVKEYGTAGSRLGNCMRGQDKLKNWILEYAQDQLGRRSLAQDIYDDCIDYHPNNGVKRISECVKTRLLLDSRLKDDIVENKIYQKCDFKWRKHGSSAIDNCSRAESTYYREKGQLQD